MLFQTLDNKKECVGYYYNNKLNFNCNLPVDFNSTWSYSHSLKNKNINYATLYCEGKSLNEVCPQSLREEWDSINKKLNAVYNSFQQSKINLRENCFFDLVPNKFLLQFCEIKNKITDYVLHTYEKPKEYIFFARFNELLNDIKYRDLNIKLDNLHGKLYKESYKSFFNKINISKKYINYDMFGSITGRLTVKKDSFPILTFPKHFRNILLPTNDWFVSFDMNAAEIRTALALMGRTQPVGDFHEWSIKDIYNNSLSRSQAKETTTSWLYNSNSLLSKKFNNELSLYFDKEHLINKYFVDGSVNTPYNRKINSDNYHAISYLNQSTFIDLFHRQILKVDDCLKNSKSFISFMIHDEFVLDVTEDEKNKIIDIINILQNTPYGLFPVNVKAGKNFGDMKKLNLKVE